MVADDHALFRELIADCLSTRAKNVGVVEEITRLDLALPGSATKGGVDLLILNVQLFSFDAAVQISKLRRVILLFGSYVTQARPVMPISSRSCVAAWMDSSARRATDRIFWMRWRATSRGQAYFCAQAFIYSLILPVDCARGQREMG